MILSTTKGTNNGLIRSLGFPRTIDMNNEQLFDLNPNKNLRKFA